MHWWSRSAFCWQKAVICYTFEDIQLWVNHFRCWSQFVNFVQLHAYYLLCYHLLQIILLIVIPDLLALFPVLGFHLFLLTLIVVFRGTLILFLLTSMRPVCSMTLFWITTQRQYFSTKPFSVEGTISLNSALVLLYYFWSMCSRCPWSVSWPQCCSTKCHPTALLYWHLGLC